jgi:hypothetical protein
MLSADLPIYQGDDVNAVITVTDATGAPADLTGYTAKAQVRKTVADSDPLVAIEIAATVSGSTVVLTISHAQTETLKGKYVWDCQLVSAAGMITTIVSGKVPVTPEVTRNAAAAGARGGIEHGHAERVDPIYSRA